MTREASLSSSGSDSEDDQDFVPHSRPVRASGSRGTRNTTAPARAGADEASRSDSDLDADSDFDFEDGNGKAQLRQNTNADEAIDADELEALRREREEMVRQAGGEERLGKRRRLAAADSSTAIVAASTEASRAEEAEDLAAKAAAEWEAIKNPTSTVSMPTPTTAMNVTEQAPEPAVTEIVVSDSITAPSAPIPTAPQGSNTPKPRPPGAGGPPRKKKSSLSALSAAATGKPVKLNTLEKSKLDWDRFKSSADATLNSQGTGAGAGRLSQLERDEIEQQTKGGASGLGNMKGYLERQDFLNRVRDRTQGSFR
ncbi:hypothetical protein BCV70DRAFT_199673 [Testicularia cyperi]|uniref:SWR1-complex protein 5 n=1 Tax=Testicularia cyperi TaxID=1882483 RepID=A0A317XR72_9BASI|nr:hypothetical protein BCV70DRAFT_199673 [Testicularia cyperi]